MIKIKPLVETIKVLDMPDSEYFKLPGINNSSLKHVDPEDGGSIEKYLERPREYNTSFGVGTAVHELVLQPESFYLDHTLEKPTSKLSFIVDEVWDLRKQGYKIHDALISAAETADYYTGRFVETRQKNAIKKCYKFYLQRMQYKPTDKKKEPIFLDKRSRETVVNCLAAVKKSSNLKRLLKPQGIVNHEIWNEVVITMDVEVTDGENTIILPLKAKIDNLTYTDGELVLNDLKTSYSYVISFEESFEKYKYARQMGFYAWMVNLAIKHFFGFDVDSFKANMLIVQTSPDYYTRVFPVSAQQIKAGLKDFMRLFKIVAKHELQRTK